MGWVLHQGWCWAAGLMLCLQMHRTPGTARASHTGVFINEWRLGCTLTQQTVGTGCVVTLWLLIQLKIKSKRYSDRIQLMLMLSRRWVSLELWCQELKQVSGTKKITETKQTLWAYCHICKCERFWAETRLEIPALVDFSVPCDSFGFCVLLDMWRIKEYKT